MNVDTVTKSLVLSLLCLAAGWEEQIAPTEAIETEKCYWAVAVILCTILIAVVAILILAAIIVVLWRRMNSKMKLLYMQHYECASGDMNQIAG